MSESPSYYAIIPASVRYDNDVPPAARLLFGELSALSNKKGYCYASNDYLASLYAVDKRSIRLWIGHLKERGHIKVELIKKGEHVTERRIYILMQESSGVGKEITSGGETNVLTPQVKNVPLSITRTNNIVNKELNTCSSSDEREREFADFYFKYPKKVGKEQALKAWNKLKPSKALIQQMHDNICDRLSAGEWSHIEKQYIPALGPYINQKKWQDEVIPRSGKNGNQQVPKLTPAQRVAAKAKQRRESQANDGDIVASYGGDVRSSMVDPIWG